MEILEKEKFYNILPENVECFERKKSRRKRKNDDQIVFSS
jgi:hypothetical protein